MTARAIHDAVGARHPAVFVELPNLGIKSSAAGRYQILFRTWDGMATTFKLHDFTPESQDIAAPGLIKRRGALDYVKSGRIELAIEMCSKEWASLPNAGYGQHENRLGDLIAEYNRMLPKYRADFSNVESGVTSTAAAGDGSGA